MNKTNRATQLYVCDGEYHGVETYTLKKNGLRVLYRYDHNVPVVGCMVTYLVGSRYEVAGSTGATHILEHLMFKGSKQFPPKRGVSVLDAFSKKGSLVNASTWFDRTNYYEVFPDEHFEYVVRLEADRMRNALITKKDLIEELPAVKSEFAMRAESDPIEFLEEQMWANAFIAHPYRHPTIGWESDIDSVTVEKLQQFYDTYYYPNNAVVTIVGNVEREYMLQTIATYFGVHAASSHSIPQPHIKEPPQLGKRSFAIHRIGTKNIVAIGHKVPEALHEDVPALFVLSSLLGDGKTSRLYRALVEKKLASQVWSSYMPFFDPSLHILFTTPCEGVSHERVERAIHTELERLKKEGVTKNDVDRVVACITTEIAFSRDGHYATLSSLNESIAAGDWKYFFDLPEKVAQVTPYAVQEVLKKYMHDHVSTVGYYYAGQ